ncbi:hypothetical protein RCO28_18495 [Streptomyces sp. LHD-70]|uniref:hypothetical protein n=1 Tax=Streptomyces sp. LHD-70 TaxID=3072140 RepID=UPI00280F81EC|nr:hypothetical protein [Streptomyces sp. LHD-70]MDQ8704463.1 hypothetical protein [Streptomyces sp. LHD-70]
MKRWMVGGWLVLVIGAWAFTESIDDGIEPSSGRTEPTPTAPSVPVDLDCPSRAPDGSIMACAYKVE